MPSKVIKNGKPRYRASVPIPGEKSKRKQRLFPDLSAKSFKDAVHWEKITKEELRNQIGITYVSVYEWAMQYLDDVNIRFVRKTYDEKRKAFERLLTFEAGISEQPVEDLTIPLANKFLTHQNCTRSGYAANKDRKNLSAAWDWGVKKIPEFAHNVINPFRAIEKMPEERSPRYIPSEEDFWEVCRIAEGQDKAMLLACLNLGSRRGELFRLKFTDIDFEGGNLTLWTRKRKGGNFEPDILPMTHDLKKSLSSWCDVRRSYDTEDKDHVFVCLDQYRFSQEYYGKPFKNRQHFMKKICRKAGVKKFGFHSIRHLTGSILYRKGHSVGFIQKVLRHKNPTTTERYLRSLGLEDIRQGMNEALQKPSSF